ncbi:MAG: hypothetical protein PHV06_04175 [bacterium]|nr:hypothetical protein [bacterium]
MDLEVKEDVQRGVEVLRRLVKSLNEQNLFEFQNLPEDIVPEGLTKGENDHLIYLSLVSAIAYLRKEERLWASARETFEDKDTKYVFDTKEVVKHEPEKIEEDLRSFGLFINKLVLKHWSIGKLKSVDRRSLRENDLEIWLNMANALNDFDGNIQKLFENYKYDGLEVLKAFTRAPYASAFPEYHKQRKVEIWLARMRRNALFEINNLENIPMPVGAHIIRTTFLTGAITGKLNSIHVDLDNLISDYWNDVGLACKEELNITPIEFQVYLWILSKYGCSVGRESEICTKAPDCPFADICSIGKFEMLDTYITIDLTQKR